jgi:hypothetical protein
LPDFADIAALVSDRICETLKHDSVAADHWRRTTQRARRAATWRMWRARALRPYWTLPAARCSPRRRARPE